MRDTSLQGAWHLQRPHPSDRQHLEDNRPSWQPDPRHQRLAESRDEDRESLCAEPLRVSLKDTIGSCKQHESPPNDLPPQP